MDAVSINVFVVPAVRYMIKEDIIEHVIGCRFYKIRIKEIKSVF